MWRSKWYQLQSVSTKCGVFTAIKFQWHFTPCIWFSLSKPILPTKIGKYCELQKISRQIHPDIFRSDQREIWNIFEKISFLAAVAATSEPGKGLLSKKQWEPLRVLLKLAPAQKINHLNLSRRVSDDQKCNFLWTADGHHPSSPQYHHHHHHHHYHSHCHHHPPPPPFSVPSGSAKLSKEGLVVIIDRIMVLNIATFGKGITISLCVIVYVVKAGQRHIVIDIAGLQRREMYVAMATNNGLSIQHDVLPIFFLE